MIHFRVVLQAWNLSGIHARWGEVRLDHKIGPELCTIIERNYIKSFGSLPKGKAVTVRFVSRECPEISGDISKIDDITLQFCLNVDYQRLLKSDY